MHSSYGVVNGKRRLVKMLYERRMSLSTVWRCTEIIHLLKLHVVHSVGAWKTFEWDTVVVISFQKYLYGTSQFEREYGSKGKYGAFKEKETVIE